MFDSKLLIMQRRMRTDVKCFLLVYLQHYCSYLSNGPDKKESNNGIEHVGMQKGANFTIVFTILLIGLNSKS